MAYDNHDSFHCFVSSSLCSVRSVRSLQQLKSPPTTVVSKEAEAAASLLELMQAPLMPERSGRKRQRDPSSESGGSAQKKTDEVTRTDDQDIRTMAPSPIDMEAVMKRLSIAETAGEINTNSSKRLQVQQRLLNQCHLDGLITFETNESNVCILGWSKLLVNDPKQLNDKIRKMIDQDEGGIWKKANGKYNQTLKNPTFSVYELFRKIGVKPRFRGPMKDDPGKHDLFYYKEWEFKNDESFKNARQRLTKGFRYCPEKGNRDRKRGPKENTCVNP